MSRSIVRLLALVLIGTSVVLAQSRRQFATADYDRAVKMLAPSLNGLVVGGTVDPTWMPDGRFWYVRTTLTGTENVVIDPVKKTREVVATPPGGAPGAPAGGAGGRGGRAGGGGGGRGGGRGGVTITKTCGPNVTGTSGPPPPSMSPDGTKALFICDWNLWVRDVATGQERQLTTDGEKDFGYATSNAGWTTSAAPSLSWSPDGKKIATQQQDERKVGDMYLVETPVNGGHPVLRAWKYPLPGDPVVAMISRVVIDVETGKITRLQMAPDFHRAMSEDNIDMGEYLWSPDGSRLGFVSTDRYHKSSTAKVADTATGAVKTLFVESEDTHVQTRVQWQISWPANEVLWYSQRDGTAQMYLYDLNTGQLKNKITNGAGPVTRVARIDQPARTMWYEAVGKEPGQDPYFTHLYKVGLDGRNHVSLTPDNGTHSAQISPDGKYVIDTFSQPDVAPETTLRDGTTGALIMPLEKADISKLLATGWKPPMPIKMKSADGKYDIYGMLFRPTNFDLEQEVPHHQQRVSRAAVGQRGLARVHRGTRRQAGPRRTRLRRRQHRRHRHAEPVKGVHRRVLRRHGPPQHDSGPDRRHEGTREEIPVDRHRQSRDVGALGRGLHHGGRAAAGALQRFLQGRHRRVGQSRPAPVRRRLGRAVSGPAREEPRRHGQLHDRGHADAGRRPQGPSVPDSRRDGQQRSAVQHATWSPTRSSRRTRSSTC